MRRFVGVLFLLSTAAVAATVPPSSATARGRDGGIKALAAAKLGIDARDVSVLATAEDNGKGAALVRVHSDVPRCHLLTFDGRPKAATAVEATVRLPVCAVYDKDARGAKLERVKLTSRQGAWRAYTDSKRMDALAKGVETRRFWGLYASGSAGFGAVFERTSTSFKSQANKAINQAEVCEAPALALGDSPSTLTITCDTEAMLGAALKKKRTTFAYRWSGSRFEPE
jgi:hypothetical protein